MVKRHPMIWAMKTMIKTHLATWFQGVGFRVQGSGFRVKVVGG